MAHILGMDPTANGADVVAKLVRVISRCAHAHSHHNSRLALFHTHSRGNACNAFRRTFSHNAALCPHLCTHTPHARTHSHLCVYAYALSSNTNAHLRTHSFALTACAQVNSSGRQPPTCPLFAFVGTLVLLARQRWQSATCVEPSLFFMPALTHENDGVRARMIRCFCTAMRV